MTDFDRPTGLSDQGNAAYDCINAHIQAKAIRRTGDRVFYSPAEWVAKGQDYGHKSELIVVYEGRPAIGVAFSLDACYEHPMKGVQSGSSECYAPMEAMVKKLEAVGLYAEECTRCHCAIYPVRNCR